MSNNAIYNYLCKKFENLNKEDSQQEIILFKSELFFDLKNIRNFENDNLKVEKYNVFLKNEKNNQYNVKK